jgi:hypothetical protein
VIVARTIGSEHADLPRRRGRRSCSSGTHANNRSASSERAAHKFGGPETSRRATRVSSRPDYSARLRRAILKVIADRRMQTADCRREIATHYGPEGRHHDDRSDRGRTGGAWGAGVHRAGDSVIGVYGISAYPEACLPLN